MTRVDIIESPLTLRLFGPFDVRLRGAPLPRLRYRKGQWLLALLTLRHGREVSRDWLAGTLWPDSAQSQAFYNLRRILSELREALGGEANRLRSPTSHTLYLDLSGAAADVGVFDEAIARGDESSLERAISLYRGPLLEGCIEEWALPEREQREQAYLTALETLAAQARARGDSATATRYLRLAIVTDPLRETAHRALMRALAASGDHAAIVQTYRELRLLLRNELNTEPDPETTALYKQLRAEARQRAEGMKGDSAKRRDGGRDEGTTVTPSPVHPFIPSRLPRPLTDLIGREKEVDEVKTFLQSARLVTLTGTGGVGKTRLAIQVAEEVAEDYLNGVWFVDLAPLSDMALVPQAVTTALDVRDMPNRSSMEVLVSFLGPKQLLLVLDNCEHLVSACAQLADALLRACPHLRLLATSRQSLGIAGEVIWHTPSLSLPDFELARGQSKIQNPKSKMEKDRMSVLMEYEAIRLFMERAGQAYPFFKVSPQNVEAVAQICQRLDGIPLAIELAATRVKVLSVEQMVERMEDRFGLLKGGSATALPRHQTLRATLDWSYDLLSEAECRLLRRLSVFAGGCTLEAAEKVCDVERDLEIDVLDGMLSLMDKSLLQRREEPGETPRFYLLETIREYGREHLEESGEAEMLRYRHARFFLALAEETEPLLHGSEQAETLDRLEREHDNFRAALAWRLAEKDEGGRACPEPAEGMKDEGKALDSSFILHPSSLGLRLAGALYWFWHLRSHFREGCDWLDRALALTSGLGRTRARAKALQGAGQLRHYLLAHAVQQSQLEESAAIYRELGDEWGYAYSLVYLANAFAMQGDGARAHALAIESVAIMRRLGDRWGLGMALWSQGFQALFFLGDARAANSILEESARLLREAGDRWACAAPLSYLGWAAHSLGDHPAARSRVQEAIVLAQEAGDRVRAATMTERLGRWEMERGDYAEARSLFKESLAICQALGYRQGLATTLEAFVVLAGAEATSEIRSPQTEMIKAARLWGAAEALREAAHAPMRPGEREEFERDTAAVRAALGEEAFAAAWAEGRAMPPEQAVEYALSEG